MPNNPFQKATKSQSKLRLGLMGPSGSGKTYTALTIASAFGKTAVIDTEHGSASKYADKFEFDVLELSDFHPQHYIDAIRAAEANGYDVIVIDSLSHAWSGAGGVLEMVDKAAKRSQSGNSFAAWRDVTPIHNTLVEAMVSSSAHLIATMRSKTEYVLETNDKGKQVPRKVGLAPVQREGMEYEFDIAAEMDYENTFMVTKTRCSTLNGAIITRPGADLATTIKDWLSDGVAKHWALNGGGQRIQAKMGTLRLPWDTVRTQVEPGTVLERLSDTSLEEWQFSARLDELAEGLASH